MTSEKSPSTRKWNIMIAILVLCLAIGFIIGILYSRSHREIDRTISTSSDWRNAYLEYLQKDPDASQEDYTLVFVDDDDIPELVILGPYEAKGNQILSYQDGKVAALQTRRLNYSFLEKKGLLLNSDGNMGSYYDDLYSLKGGNWQLIASGTYGSGTQDSPYTYQWEGKPVSKEQYEKKLNHVYREKNSSIGAQTYNYTEIKQMLTTGKLTVGAPKDAEPMLRTAWSDNN